MQKSKTRFEKLLTELQNWHPEAATYIREIDPSRYATYAVMYPRFGHTTSNIVEVANSAILKFRGLAPFRLVVDLRRYIMLVREKWQSCAKLLQGRLTPFAENKWMKNEELSGSYRVWASSEHEALVAANSGNKEYVVRLQPKMECSCIELQDQLFPCPHLVVFDREKQKDSEVRVNQVWSVDTLTAGYAVSIPAFVSQDLMMILCCGRPPQAVIRGRQRVRRIPSCGGQVNRGDHTYAEFPIEESLKTVTVDVPVGGIQSVPIEQSYLDIQYYPPEVPVPCVVPARLNEQQEPYSAYDEGTDEELVSEVW
ncbi:hypothetical protein R1flu_023799 [Riccia fluitans]|uniref:SWIM-type domain-containing protein n=1 Tax=Riccia fluitans TaxID=41844 RepID=A0ABD1XT28_9MARC